MNDRSAKKILILIDLLIVSTIIAQPVLAGQTVTVGRYPFHEIIIVDARVYRYIEFTVSQPNSKVDIQMFVFSDGSISDT